MRLLIVLVSLFHLSSIINAQGFIIKDYHTKMILNPKGYLEVDEKINVFFTESRRGIIRVIPYKFKIAANTTGEKRAEGFSKVNSTVSTAITDINVSDWEYKIENKGSQIAIRIGSPDKYLTGAQEYHIRYIIHDVVTFFEDHAELYYNVIGLEWNAPIEKASYEIILPKDIPDKEKYFTATGSFGSKENKSNNQWTNNRTLSGSITAALAEKEGMTVGISFPRDFVIKENYKARGWWWLGLLPICFFSLFYWLWKKYGKDDRFSIQTEYQAPAEISPAIAGYLMNDRHKKRDLTSLIPYWGQQGYLQIREIEHQGMFSFTKNKELEFTQLKALPYNVPQHELRMFNAIFAYGNPIMLGDLKDKLYIQMQHASDEIENHIESKKYYTETGNMVRDIMLFVSFLLIVAGGISIFYGLSQDSRLMFYIGAGLVLSSIPGFIIHRFMPKKTKIGTEAYKHLCGFKEFITTVEKDKLEYFLKQDPGYFDKVLPYAIVFNVAKEWKKRFEGLEIPAPSWYIGSQPNFSYYHFMNNIDRDLDQVSDNIYSTPESASSGGSWSSSGGGGGGFSGGGFGGGGGSSW